jgi:sulfotransferase family protein
MAVRPNFFIVGAPKCGTTALYEYLRTHPNIFFPNVKEPHFFAKDLGNYPRIKTLRDYEAMYAQCTKQHLRRGEASVYYLRSSVAVANIHEFDPNAKLIAMFRNPVDMLYSLHSQLLFVSEENEPDFETAWRLQGDRERGIAIPPAIRSPKLVQYSVIGQLGSQAERLLSIFPQHQVKFIVFDDFAAAPQRIYDEVIQFLEIPHDGRSEFPRINENKRAKIAWLRDFSRKPPRMLHRVFRRMKQFPGSEGLVTAKKKIVALNTVKERRPPLSREFRAELGERFRGEVRLLSQILDRDLSHWR